MEWSALWTVATETFNVEYTRFVNDILLFVFKAMSSASAMAFIKQLNSDYSTQIECLTEKQNAN